MGTGVSSSRITLSDERTSHRTSQRQEETGSRRMSQLSSVSAARERSRSPSPRGTPKGSRNTTPKGTPRLSGSTEGGDVAITKAEIETKSLDIMISYSHSDKEMMNKIKENLENNGIKAWVDVIGLGAGVDFLSKIGQAIIDAKLFVSLLSEKSVESKYCQDELALAYVSNKPIIPVGLAEREKLIPKMGTGMRLQLAGFHWTMFLEPNKFDESFHELLTFIQDALEKQKSDTERQNEKTKKQSTDKSADSKKPAPLERQSTRYRFYTRTSSKKERVGLSDKQKELPDSFWDRNFKTSDEIPYDKFVETVKREYKEELDDMYNKADQEWLMNLLRRELEVDDDAILLKDYFITKQWLVGFCTVDEVVCALWVRIEDQARESYAMREVFNMESSVRVEAIENLGKFKSFAVVDALRDLLDDHEPNVRTVAAVSLAKTGATDKHTIKKLLRTLNDKDRLVREAGCIALGRLKAEHAVPRLVHIWRNDVISSVRDAAGLALEQIGGPQAEKAIHITKILAEEIRMLAKH